MDGKVIDIDGQKYGERELAQLIRRKMLQKNFRNKKKYTRKIKHICKNSLI